eukprot:402120-Pelagomonas_calceolata.AAC.5
MRGQDQNLPGKTNSAFNTCPARHMSVWIPAENRSCSFSKQSHLVLKAKKAPPHPLPQRLRIPKSRPTPTPTNVSRSHTCRAVAFLHAEGRLCKPAEPCCSELGKSADGLEAGSSCVLACRGNVRQKLPAKNAETGALEDGARLRGTGRREAWERTLRSAKNVGVDQRKYTQKGALPAKCAAVPDSINHEATWVLRIGQLGHKIVAVTDRDVAPDAVSGSTSTLFGIGRGT